MKQQAAREVSRDLIGAIRAFPVRRAIEHSRARIAFDAFDFHVVCPRCGARIKVRSFSALPESEDVLDAVFEWMNQEGAQEVAERRGVTIAAEE